MPPIFDISEARDDRGQVRLLLAGELDMATAHVLAERLRRAATRGEAVVVDLSDLTFMDSSGLRLLLRAAADSQRDGWQLGIRRPPPRIWRSMEVSGAGPFLPLVED